MKSIVSSKKSLRAFLEQTVGEVVLEASMLGAGMLVNPVWHHGETEEDGAPAAIFMIATGEYAGELLDQYKAFVAAKRAEVAAAEKELPLFNPPQEPADGEPA